MRILSLELENIKSYASQRLEFSEGVNAIVGFNGAGKSTLLEAIGFALFGCLDYTLVNFVREGAPDGRVSVRFESSADGRVYEVLRRVGASSAQSIVDVELGTRLCAGAADVGRFLREHMGLDPHTDTEQLFRDAVGVPQGALTAAFLAIPSKRKGMFDPLLHVDEYQQAFERLKETKTLLTQRVGEQNVAIARLEGLLQQLPALEARASALAVQVAETVAAVTGTQRELALLEARYKELVEQRTRLTTAEQARDARRGEEIEARSRAQLAGKMRTEAEDARQVVEKHQAGHDRYVAGQQQKATLDVRVQERQAIDMERALAAGDEKQAQERKANAARRLEEIAASARRLEVLAPLVEQQSALEQQRERARTQVAESAAAQQILQQSEAAWQRESSRLAAMQQQAAAQPELEARANAVASTLATLRGEVETLAIELAGIESEGKRRSDLIDEVSKAEGAAICPVCQQPLAPHHIHDLRARYDQERADLRQQYAERKAVRVSAQDRLAQAEADLEAIDARRRKLPAAATLEEMAQNVDGLAAQMAGARQRADELKDSPVALQALEAQLAALGNPRAERDLHAQIVAGRAAAIVEVEEAGRDAAVAAMQIANLDDRRRTYAELDTDLAHVVEVLAGDLPAYQAVLGHAQAAGQLTHRRAEHESSLEALATCEAAAAAAEAAVQEAASAFDAIAYAGVQTGIGRLQGALSGLASQKELLGREQASVSATLADLRVQQNELTGLRLAAASLRDQEQVLDKMRTVIKNAGPYIGNALIQRISGRADQFFGELTEDFSRRLRWGNDYGITLEVDGRERDFKSLSGGEQMVAALAVRLALLREVSAIDIAFFDEPTAHLDHLRRDNLVAQILAIRGFRQLFVISHDDTFERSTDSVIRVERVNGISRVVA